MSEQDFKDILSEALAMYMDEGSPIKRVCSFSDAGVLSTNEGLVVSLEDGSQFQLTIVQSR